VLENKIPEITQKITYIYIKYRDEINEVSNGNKRSTGDFETPC